VRGSDGSIFLGSNGAQFAPSNTSGNSFGASFGTLGFSPPSTWQSGGNHLQYLFLARNNTLGTNNAVIFKFGGDTWSPSSGAGNQTYLNISSTYNQTGTASGNVVGIDYNPTVTSVLGNHYAALFRSGNVGIGNAAPARTLHVTGTERVTGSVDTATVTALIGTSALGDRRWITVGSGLSYSSGTLSATGTSYNFAELTVSGGSTSATAGTPERPDNDTPGSASTTIVGTFSTSGSTLDYTGSAGQGKVSGVISFTTSGGGDVLISIFKEGTEIASTEVREAVNAIYTTVALPLATTGLATNDTFEIRIEPVTGSNTITVHRYTMFIEKIY
jgi:hypothetical protein